MSYRVKYLAGWITADGLRDPRWVSVWFNAAEAAELQNCELTVFLIPKNKAGTTAEPEAVEAIEKLLQEKFKK